MEIRKSVTYLRTDRLIGVGARNTCVSKKLRYPPFKYVTLIILREETFVTMYTWVISLCLAALVNRVDAKFPKAMNNPYGSKMINPATNKRRQGRS